MGSSIEYNMEVQSLVRMVTEERMAGGVVQTSSGASASTAQAVELRLMLPCIAIATVFIAGQFLINGGIARGKWAGYAVMAIFSVQSILPPVFRLLVSSLLRQHVKKAFATSASSTMAVTNIKPSRASMSMRPGPIVTPS